MNERITRYVALPATLTRAQMFDLLAAMNRTVYVSYLDPKAPPRRTVLIDGVDPTRPHHILHGRLNGVDVDGISLDNSLFLPFRAMPAIGLDSERKEGGVLIVRHAQDGELVYVNPKRPELVARLTEAQMELVDKEEAVVRQLSSAAQAKFDSAIDKQLQCLKELFTERLAREKFTPDSA